GLSFPIPKSDQITQPVIEDSDETECYQGVTIDQQFSFIAERSFTEEEPNGKTYSVEAGDYLVTFKDFTPNSIRRKGKSPFNFKVLYPGEYYTNVIGISHLLGAKSTQIYVVATGTGAVCCTNYWISDVSTGTPRSIFRSEDFGAFRDPMEVFDADNDGIYELVQFDSAFRYFMGDCGSCSPQPRAVFKYDKRTGVYVPAKNLQQDFVAKSFRTEEEWLKETATKLKLEQDPNLELDFRMRLLEQVASTFYLGDERRAWNTFDRYWPGSDKRKVRAEIRRRLSRSKFYRALRLQGN
ncbi:MAG TPA: hypothetical protein PKO33_04000, partial [Pyrinomonadaceae bacterium]|nr:hypothetical protein [Pyrinomonadaceae bacterium]